MSLTLTERYWAARITIVFITFIFSLLGTIVLTWMVRRHRDSARWCFTFAKFIGFLFSVYCFVDLCCYILGLAFSRLLSASKARDYENEEIVAALLLGRVELSAVARMCDYLVIIFIFLSLITMGNGIIHSRTGSPGKNSKTIKRTADGMAVLIVALATAEWGLRIRIYLDFYLEDHKVKQGGGEMPHLLNISRQLDFVAMIISLLCSLATMGRAVSIYLSTRADKQIYWPSHCLFFCSSMWLLRTLYDTVYQIRYLDLVDVARSRQEEYYISVISAVFYILPVLCILYAILALGTRKGRGLWSSQQSWMSYDPDGSQDVPLEPQTNNLPPAYSPPLGSTSPPMHPQQATETLHHSPATEVSPISQPQAIMRRPLPPLSTVSGPASAQQGSERRPSDALTYSAGSHALSNNQQTPSSSSNSPGSSQRPFVIEDRGPAPLSLSHSPQSHAQVGAGLSSTRQPDMAGVARNDIVPEASTAAGAASAASAQTQPLVSASAAIPRQSEKPSSQPPQTTASQSTAADGEESPARYQQAPADNGYNTGLVLPASPVSPVDLVPADGFYEPTAPPSHDEAMGFNHQADGRAPTQPLPYPEKN